MSRRGIYISGIFAVVATFFIVSMQSIAKYAGHPLITSLLFFLIGVIYTGIHNKSVIADKIKSIFPIVFTVAITLLLFAIAYFIPKSFGVSIVMVAVLYCSCFLLPYSIFQSWNFFSKALEPIYIGPWLVGELSTADSSVSLYLNSIHLAFQLQLVPNTDKQNLSIIAPGVKTLGRVFSDLFSDAQHISDLPPSLSDFKIGDYQWTFSIQKFAGLVTRQLDANLSLIDNQLRDNDIIIVHHSSIQ